jgi:hypothetical protein
MSSTGAKLAPSSLRFENSTLGAPAAGKAEQKAHTIRNDSYQERLASVPHTRREPSRGSSAGLQAHARVRLVPNGTFRSFHAAEPGANLAGCSEAGLLPRRRTANVRLRSELRIPLSD